MDQRSLFTMTKKNFSSPEWLKATITQRGIWITLYGIMKHIKGTANVPFTDDTQSKFSLSWQEIAETQKNCTLYRIKSDKKESRVVRINLFESKVERMLDLAEKIYQEYPKKAGKPVALRAIAKALEKESFDHLLQRTKEFAEARSDQEKNFTPHPSTWFNQERYNDDPETWRKETTNTFIDNDKAFKL